MSTNPYESPKEEPDGDRAPSRIVPYVALGISSVGLTSLAFTVAAAWALSDWWPWELSPANVRFALLHSVALGVIGAGLSMLAYSSATVQKLPVATGIMFAWATISGVCFYVYIGLGMR